MKYKLNNDIQDEIKNAITNNNSEKIIGMVKDCLKSGNVDNAFSIIHYTITQTILTPSDLHLSEDDPKSIISYAYDNSDPEVANSLVGLCETYHYIDFT